MTAQLAPVSVAKFFSNDGFPLAFGQLTTYAAGTTTPQATYVDSTQTTQNTNPIILNFRGECNLWLDPTKSYKFLLQDLSGNTIPGWPVDNIPGGPFISASGSLTIPANLIPSPTNTLTLGNPSFSWANVYIGVNNAPVLDTTSGNIGYYKQTTGESSNGITPVNFSYQPGDVRRYGAKCDNSTNDTTSINNALLCNNYVWITGVSVASGIKMLSDGQILFGIGRASGINALNNTTPCITLSANRQIVQDLILGTGALGNNDTNNYTVTNISQAASAVVTINTVSGSNPVVVGQWVTFLSVVGMTQINSQQPAQVTATGGSSGAWTFTLSLNSSGFSAYVSGGVANTTGFIAVLLAGATRALIQRVATSGVWCHAIDLEAALYSTVTYCNVDGFRKRGININGGGDCRVLFNMVFDGTLAAPTDAHVFINEAAAIHIRDNLITRSGSSAGPAIYAFDAAGSFLGQLLWITDNVIDNGQNWAIQTNGYWDLHIQGNWCAWGQSSSNTGQISVTNSQKFYIRDNDVYGSLLQGVGIAITTSNNGIVSGNTIEYNYNNVVITNCSNMTISENISGQLTGLPPSGVPTQNAYLESGCSAGCQVFWVNNIAYLAVVAAYGGITNTVVSNQGYNNSEFNVQTGNYTLILADRNGTVLMNSGTAKALTIPSGVGFASGDKVVVISGQATVANTIVPGSGITLLFANGTNTSGTRTLTGVGYTVLEFITSTVVIASAGSGLT